MVTEEEIIGFMREQAYKPMTYQELEQHYGIGSADEFKELLKLLNKLEHDGKVLRTRTERYGVPERMNLIRGKLQAHAKGFGFVLPDDRDHPDIYIHANDLKSAMNNDIVLTRVTSRGAAGGKLEGEIVRIVSRANTQIVGTFEHHESYGFVIPDDKRIIKDLFIPREAFGGAVNGQKVVANIVRYPEGRAAAEGEVVEILGHKDDPGVDILSIIRKYQLPENFPDEVMEEASNAPDTISEEEIKGRRDLRDLKIVTIDGEDAKDLDDAVNVERLPNGNYKLGVHIADVGYYVREKSQLDQEAYRRGCSVYLVDRVIPMLPHRLSNGICSLNPQVDRLTMSCEMEFDEHCRVVKHDVFTSVIRTKERMTYTNVRKILVDQDEELLERYADLVDDFRMMEQLAMKLRKARMQRGAIDFDFQESKVLVDAEGKPTDIVKRERSVAEQIIEEFMLAANETVAEHFHWLKVPFLYRIHEDPDSEKLMNFMRFISNFGYVVRGKGNTVHPRALQTLLEEIKDTKEETVISTVMLRSMKQAKYDAESLGHFGLAAEFYTHFTSPIRRYPDLVIHRIMREVIESGGMLSEKRHEYLSGRMPDIATQSSERERVAVDAERETDALKKAEFMLDKIGEEFEGIISSVTSFGMFVELDNSVEGLIRLSDLSDDYYHFHEMQLALVGERTSKIYRIGDEVKVRVARVNVDERTIDFEMVDMKPRGKKFSVVDEFTSGGHGGGGGFRGAGGFKGFKGGKKKKSIIAILEGRSSQGEGGPRKKGKAGASLGGHAGNAGKADKAGKAGKAGNGGGSLGGGDLGNGVEAAGKKRKRGADSEAVTPGNNAWDGAVQPMLFGKAKRADRSREGQKGGGSGEKDAWGFEKPATPNKYTDSDEDNGRSGETGRGRRSVKNGSAGRSGESRNNGSGRGRKSANSGVSERSGEARSSNSSGRGRKSNNSGFGNPNGEARNSGNSNGEGAVPVLPGEGKRKKKR